MTQIEQTDDRKFIINFGPQHPAAHGVSYWHSSPSPCSSPSGRGDGGLRAFVFSNAIFGSKVFHLLSEIVVEFTLTSLLPWGEEQDEGVSCFGGAHD